MATDFLLLQRYPAAANARFRHYEWRNPAVTFGFGQKIDFVRGQLAAIAGVGSGSIDLCRRPTGGGIVDHRNDWTYSLVIPRDHPLYDERATQSYRLVHEALARVLVSLGEPAEAKQACDPCTMSGDAAAGAGVCFQRAELYDVVNSRTGTKIAGAAQKRNKQGLLFQGSIDKGSIGPVDWEEFGGAFAGGLADVLGADGQETPWPELNDDELAAVTEQYASPAWIEYR